MVADSVDHRCRQACQRGSSDGGGYKGSVDINSVQLARLLAQEDRRRVVAALILADEPCTTSQIAETTGLGIRDIVDATDRLASAGLVRTVDDAVELLDAVFQQIARAEVPPATPSAHGDQPDDVARVLDVAFRDGKLVQWPAKRTKRLFVLDHLAQQFEIGERYTEASVNEILKPFNEDVATSRRYLVDEQFLDRGEGFYWRCGGSI